MQRFAAAPTLVRVELERSHGRTISASSPVISSPAAAAPTTWRGCTPPSWGRHLELPVYAILGDRDFIRFVPPLGSVGYTFLRDETVVRERDGARLYLSSVNDPHFYETDNLQSTREAIPSSASPDLLAHSPEICRHAAAAGYDFIMSGRTHAGGGAVAGKTIRRREPTRADAGA